MKFLFILILFLASCSNNQTQSNYNFKDDMTFNEFKQELEKYANSDPYPNIED